MAGTRNSKMDPRWIDPMTHRTMSHILLHKSLESVPSFELGREREMFYLTTHSTHFIYGYMVSDIWLRTILIVRKETRCRHIGYSYRLAARVLLYAPSHRQDNTYHGLCYTSFELGVSSSLSTTSKPLSWTVSTYNRDVFRTITLHLHYDWCNKGRGMRYPVCGMVHIKEPLLLIDKSSLCGDSGFPLSLSEWSLTVCLTPYNRR